MNKCTIKVYLSKVCIIEYTNYIFPLQILNSILDKNMYFSVRTSSVLAKIKRQPWKLQLFGSSGNANSKRFSR